ncbi:MAG: hypothetical protein N2Z74_05975, partial [Syntrophales bacterium]|nr:hypothetical protein [Syntrophales bacterium]
MDYVELNNLNRILRRAAESPQRLVNTYLNIAKFSQLYGLGVLKYTVEFMVPYWTALQSFQRLERDKLRRTFILQSLFDYLELMQFNIQIAEKGFLGSLSQLRDFRGREAVRAASALVDSLLATEGAGVQTYTDELVRMAERVIYGYPHAIDAIADEYGFHFDDGGYVRIAETERFVLYQVLSRDPAVEC